MAESKRLVAEALVAAVLIAAAERFRWSSSQRDGWVADLTEPPDDLCVTADMPYTGLLLILRNKVKRALLLGHRRPVAPVRNHPSQRQDWGPSFGSVDDWDPGLG